MQGRPGVRTEPAPAPPLPRAARRPTQGNKVLHGAEYPDGPHEADARAAAAGECSW